jgi:hypothetical protein
MISYIDRQKIFECPLCKYKFKYDLIEKFREEMLEEGLLIKIEEDILWEYDQCEIFFKVVLPEQSRNIDVQQGKFKINSKGITLISLCENTLLTISVDYDFKEKHISSLLNHTVISNPLVKRDKRNTYYVANLYTSNNTKRDANPGELSKIICLEEAEILSKEMKMEGIYDYQIIKRRERFRKNSYSINISKEKEEEKSIQSIKTNRKVKSVSNFSEENI